MKVAVPTGDFKTIWKDHFGDAPFYLIFDVNPPCFDFLEARKNLSGHEEHEEGHGDPRKFKKVIELLEDVEVFVAYAVGPNVIRLKKQTDKKLLIIRSAEKIPDVLREVAKKLGYETFRFKGKLFYEIIEFNGQKMEHAGFKDEAEEFPKVLFSFVGPERQEVPAEVVLIVREGEEPR